MSRNIPAAGRDLGNFERMPLSIADAQVIDVLGELMDGVTPRRRTAHHQFQHRLAHAGKRGADFRLVVSGVRET